MAKKIFIIAAVAVLIIAAVICTIFLIKTKDLEPEEKGISLEGTWRIFKTGNSEQGVEYFVFDGSSVKNYREGMAEPAFESAYSMNGIVVTVDKLSEDFSVEKKTDNVMLLYNQENEYLLVRARAENVTAAPTYTRSDFVGTYNVLLHANGVFGEEVITFDADQFVCTRNGETFLATTFTVENNVLKLVTPKGAMELKICYNDGDVIRLVETGTDERGRIAYLAWEITLAEG